MNKLEKIQIANYTQKSRDGILQLMSSVPYKKLIWQWQFEENPYGLAYQPIVIKHGEKIVGFNGEMGVEIQYNGKTSHAIWSCDFYVHADYRGKGIGKIIKDKQFNSNNIVMALGLSNSAVSVWKKRSCMPNDEIFVLRKYRKIDSIKRSFCYLYQTVEYIKGLSIRVNSKNHHYKISDSLENKQDVDKLWETVCNSYRKIVVRNYDYLHWRYERHPVASYQFIHVFLYNKLAAIGIVRQSNNSSIFVDMVVHISDIQARTALVTGWLELHSSCETYQCVSTDALLIKCLLAHGFYKTRNKQWFFVYSTTKNDTNPEQNWFIMPGDSDGEFLSAAKDGCESEDSKENIRVEEINDDLTFCHLRHEWTDLLNKSEANKLFLSWEWQYTWWETWAETLGLQLMLLKAHNRGSLVGIAPLYIDNITLRGGIKIKRIQFIGNAWRRIGTVRTEYLEFISDKSVSKEVCTAFVEYLFNNKNWDEFIICDLQTRTDTYRQIKNLQENRRWYTDIVDQDQGVKISVLGKFDNYIKRLGSNTRLKLFNRRQYLESLGTIKHISASKEHVNQFLSILNHFHQKRWGKDCFTGYSLNFHKKLLNRLNSQQSYCLECLQFNGKAISIIYNLIAGDTVFNIQSGFNEKFDSKLSLGTMHMGYAIENAFSNQSLVNFDMLAGKGKSEFYKCRYKGTTVKFVTLRVSKSRKLTVLYIIFHRTRNLLALLKPKIYPAIR